MKKEKYVIVRTYSAGVWFGIVKKLDNTTVIITKARRLWYWNGAASLSELAVNGTSKPNECKFPVTIEDADGVYLPQVIEILPCTEKAVESIKSVKIWTA